MMTKRIISFTAGFIAVTMGVMMAIVVASNVQTQADGLSPEDLIIQQTGNIPVSYPYMPKITSGGPLPTKGQPIPTQDPFCLTLPVPRDENGVVQKAYVAFYAQYCGQNVIKLSE